MTAMRMGALIVLCFVLPSLTPQAEAVSAKKILIGIGMMAGGTILVVHETGNCILSECDDTPRVAALLCLEPAPGS